MFLTVCFTSSSPGRAEVASPGDSRSLSCSLPDASGVKQVTWQRLGRDQSVVTMATFSENFRAQVTEAYADKVEVLLAKLNHTTIEIRNITFSDEGCYVCTFNVYPSGTERRKTCLSVQGKSPSPPPPKISQISFSRDSIHCIDIRSFLYGYFGSILSGHLAQLLIFL